MNKSIQCIALIIFNFYLSASSQTNQEIIISNYSNLLLCGVNNKILCNITDSIVIKHQGKALPKEGPFFRFTPKECDQQINMEVYSTQNGKNIHIGTKTFTPIAPTPPKISVAGKTNSGFLYKEEIKNLKKIDVAFNRMFEAIGLIYTVKSYQLSVWTQDTLLECHCQGELICPKAQTLLNRTQPGDKIYFEEVFCNSPAGGDLKIGAIYFEVKEDPR